MALALQSSLSPDILSAFGTHRYYSDTMTQTCKMVARLAEGADMIFAIEVIYTDGISSRWHCYDRAQVNFVQSGTMTIMGADYTLVVPAGHAIWIPAGYMHQVITTGGIAALATYVDPRRLPDLPLRACALQVSGLFEPLLKRLIEHQLKPNQGAVFDALMVLLNEELKTARSLEVATPMPKDRRLRRVCEAVLRDPSIGSRKEQLARIGNISSRTMTRLFRSELNLTYSDWLQLTLAFYAIGLLARGQTVAQVAFNLGYCSPSAFTAMFRRRFGICPSEVISNKKSSLNLAQYAAR